MAVKAKPLVETTLNPREQRLLVNHLLARVTGNVHRADFRSNIETGSAAATALGVLPQQQQSDLAIIARSYEGPRQEFVREQALYLLLLSNWGFMRGFAATHAGGKKLDPDLAFAAGWTATAKAIESWDPNHESGASFLRHLQMKFWGEISPIASMEEHRPFRVRAQYDLQTKVQMTAKKLEGRGVKVDAETIARVIRAEAKNKKLQGEEVAVDPVDMDVTLEEIDAINDVLELTNLKIFSLDGEWVSQRGDAGEPGVPTISRPHGLVDLNADTEASVVDQEFSNAVTAAVYDDGAGPCACCGDRAADQRCVNALTDLERFLVVAYHDISGFGEVEQNELFDGVYEDASGRWFSSEDSVINDREARLAADPDDYHGGLVTKMAQSELTLRFEAGELRFIPGNDLSMRVFELLGDTPPTQARVQAPLYQAHEKLRARITAGAPEIAEEMRSRGRNAIEYSGAAEQQVRAALIAFARQQGGTLMLPNFEPVSVAKIDRMKAGRPTADGSVKKKSQLREYGEALGLIDIDTGALNEHAIQRLLEPTAPMSPVKAKPPSVIEQLEQQGVKQLVATVGSDSVVLELAGGKCQANGVSYESLGAATRALGGRDQRSFWQAGINGEMVQVGEIIQQIDMQIGAVVVPRTPKPRMQDIYAKGLIPEGKLVGTYKGGLYEALYDVKTGKFLVFSEGKKVGEADTPSVASKLVSKEENGFNFWKVERDGKHVKLGVLRNECAQMMLADREDSRPQLSSLGSVSAPNTSASAGLDITV